MEINVNEIEYCKLDIQYRADVEQIEAKRMEVISSFKKARVKGFRPGKATVEAIKAQYRKEIAETLKQAMAEEAYKNVITTKNIKPFGNPTFLELNLNDNNFSCKFSLHIMPEFGLKEYKGFTIPKVKDSVSIDELTEKMCQEVRERQGTTRPFIDTDFVQDGDSIIIDYQGFIEGTLVDKLNVQGEMITVGKSILEDFNSNLFGMKIGDTREFVVNIPQDSSSEFANKSITFNTTLNSGSKVEPAPLNDDLAKKFGFENLDVFRSNVQTIASERARENEFNYVADQVAKRLIANHDFAVPNWISTAEAQMKVSNSGRKWDDISDIEKEDILKQASDSVKVSLILNQIRENEPDAQLTDEEVFNIVKENIAKFSTEPAEQVMNTLLQNGKLSSMISQIKNEFTINFIVKNSTITE